MDIYQMGGENSLYDKIDRGIRGCKVVVSIMTPKYAMSANCRREVSLCDALKKPVVPLLLEDMTWPPSGPMSMVFTQLLYIDFHSTPGIQESWQCDEFDQLLTKIQQYVPDHFAIEESKPSPKKVAIPTKVVKSETAPAKSPKKENTTPTKATKPEPAPVAEKRVESEARGPPAPPRLPVTEPAKDVAVSTNESAKERPPSAMSTKSNKKSPRSNTPADTSKKSKSCCIL